MSVIHDIIRNIYHLFRKRQTATPNDGYRPTNVPVIDEVEHSYFADGVLSHNTTTTASYFVWFLLFHYDMRAMVVANKGNTGIEIVGKIREVIEDLPFFLKPGIVNLAKNKIRFENGCQLSTAAASKSPATGDSINLLYVDEAALIPNNIIDEYWASIYPTLSSFRGSQIILSSTPRGKGNLFYKMYMQGLNNQNGWVHSRVDYYEVPSHDEEWCKQQIEDLGEDLFRREVLLSFESDGGKLVKLRSLRFMNKIKQIFVNREFYSVPYEISDKIIWAPDFDPTMFTYQDMKSRRFLLSIDLAKGIEAGAAGKKDSDYNVINIFEIEMMSPIQIEKNRGNNPITLKDCIQYKQVGLYLDNMKSEAACAEAAKMIAFQIFKCGYKDIDNVRILVEMNFNGPNWLNIFKTHPSYYNGVLIKTQNGPAIPGQAPKMMYGYITKGGNMGKNYYCELGGALIAKRAIILRQYMEDEKDVSRSTIGEIDQFGKNEKGVYMGLACHDDIAMTCVMLAIAHDSKHFMTWVEEWVDSLGAYGKAVTIKRMLDMYVEKEMQMSDELFKAFYSAASANFGKLTHKQNGYGSLMNGNVPEKPIDFGTILPSRVR